MSTTPAPPPPAQATPLHPHPIYTLHSEILLQILDLLTPEELISFALAHYPLLLLHGLAPTLTRSRLARLVARTRTQAHPLVPLPTELVLKTMRMLPPGDMLSFAFADYQALADEGIAPRMTPATVKALRGVIRHGD